MRRRPRVSLWTLRIILVLHTIAICSQPIMAGYFLAGEVDAMNLHSPIGSTLWLLGIVQLLAAGAYWLRGGGPYPTLWSAVLCVAEFVQITFGYLQNFAVHVPLGTAIVVIAVWMTVRSFRRQEVTR